jgi:hypothetical protein
MAAAEAMDSPDHVAEARACLVWLARQDRHPHDVITLAEQIAGPDAAMTYHVSAGISPHKWVYLWPLMAAHLDTGQVAEAVAAGRQLLHPAQQRLPDELESAVTAACLAWDQGEREAGGKTLTAALALARDLRYI